MNIGRRKIYHNESEYSDYFLGEKRKKAFEAAQDIRKFEIDLYWKRTAYMWTIIAAAFVGFGAAQQLADKPTKTDMSVVVACLGTVLSLAWFLINKGIKYWQTNWEQNVQMLEDDVTGPLYKLNWWPDRNVSSRLPLLQKAQWWLIEGDRFSVTRINQFVSSFVFMIWVLLLWHVLPPISPRLPINFFYTSMVSLSVCSWLCMIFLCKSGRGRPHSTFTILGEEPPVATGLETSGALRPNESDSDLVVEVDRGR